MERIKTVRGESFQPATRTTVAEILRRIADQCDNEPLDAEVYAQEVNDMLDGLLEEDFFGTEGQLDPRGDHRD